MSDQIDIYRAARLLIKQYGADAEKHARAKLDDFMKSKDVVAASAWLMILQAIEELNETAPIEKKTLH